MNDELPINDVANEIKTLEAMFKAFSPGECFVLQAQLNRIKTAQLGTLTKLVEQFEIQRRTIVEAINDVMLEVTMTQHDLESTRRERDALKNE